MHINALFCYNEGLLIQKIYLVHLWLILQIKMYMGYFFLKEYGILDKKIWDNFLRLLDHNDYWGMKFSALNKKNHNEFLFGKKN
jgi:hypothetical protein